MKKAESRIDRIERLMNEHLRRNPLKIDIDALTPEERQSLIEFGQMLQRVLDTHSKEEAREIAAGVWEMRENSRGL